MEPFSKFIVVQLVFIFLFYFSLQIYVIKQQRHFSSSRNIEFFYQIREYFLKETENKVFKLKE